MLIASSSTKLHPLFPASTGTRTLNQMSCWLTPTHPANRPEPHLIYSPTPSHTNPPPSPPLGVVMSPRLPPPLVPIPPLTHQRPCPILRDSACHAEGWLAEIITHDIAIELHGAVSGPVWGRQLRGVAQFCPLTAGCWRTGGGGGGGLPAAVEGCVSCLFV